MAPVSSSGASSPAEGYTAACAGVHPRLRADLRAGGDLGPDDLARGERRDTQFIGQDGGLGSLAGSGRTEQDDPHEWIEAQVPPPVEWISSRWSAPGRP